MKRVIGVLVLAVAALVSGCTTTVAGHANPTGGTGDSGTSASAKASAGAACERSAKPETCQEWTSTTPVTGDALLASAGEDPAATAQMVCSALSEQALDTYLKPGHYRFVENGNTCSMWSGDGELAVRIGINPANALSEYLSRFKGDPQLASMVTELTVAGAPAMRASAGHETDGKGTDTEDLTIAPTGNPDGKGVLQIQLLVRQPRGKADSTPIDRGRLDIRDALIGDVLKTLFP
ncbi:hypothetical protein A6A25_24515 [Saccharothrix sp. CB00851]|nr:hypothetical protein A6A25_24515 [Saccharothrix sp. CB00851]